MPAKANVFSINNVPIPAAPPAYFTPSSNGAPVPAGHTSWVLTFTTTGLPAGQLLADITVQYHYTNAQLGVTGQPNQGQVTNLDGTVTEIPGGTFTGWIDDCESALPTTYTDKSGNTVFASYLGCDLNRIPGYYPDRARFLISSSPGYASVPNVTLALN